MDSIVEGAFQFGRGFGFVRFVAIAWMVVTVGATIAAAGAALHFRLLAAIGVLIWWVGVTGQFGLVLSARRRRR